MSTEDAMSAGSDWLDEHLDELFHFGEEPKFALFYGTEKDFEEFLENLERLAGDEDIALKPPNPYIGGIIGAILDYEDTMP